LEKKFKTPSHASEYNSLVNDITVEPASGGGENSAGADLVFRLKPILDQMRNNTKKFFITSETHECHVVRREHIDPVAEICPLSGSSLAPGAGTTRPHLRISLNKPTK